MSLMILGVLCRLSPMALEVRPRRGAVGWIVLALWLVGALGIVFHVARGEWYGLWTSGLSTLLAAILLPALHPGVLKRAREGDWIARYAAAGMAHLILAAALGVLIGLNKHLGLVRVDPLRVLGAHLHLAAGGWVTFLILGFGRRLHPTLAPAGGTDPGATRLRFWLLEFSLAGLVLGFLGVDGLVPVAAPLGAIAVGLHLGRPLRRFASGRITDRASAWVSVALLGLVAAVLLGVAVAWGLPERAGLSPDQARFAYGFLLLFGWITPAITAFSLKLFPLWVWQERFGRDLGVRPVPAMKSLYSTRLQAVTGWGLALGTAIVVAGLLGEWEAVQAVGIRVYAAGVTAFLANFVRMARWGLLRKPYRPSPEDVARFESVYR
jgi:hypothetical protein